MACRGVWFSRDVEMFSHDDPRGADRAQVCGYPGIAAAHCKLDRGQYRPVSPGWANRRRRAANRMRPRRQTRAGGAAVKSRRNGQSGSFAGERNRNRAGKISTGCRSRSRGKRATSKNPSIRSRQPARPVHSRNPRCRFWMCGRWSPSPACQRLRARQIRQPVLTRCGGFRPSSRVFPRLLNFRLRGPTKPSRIRPLPRRK